MTGRRTLVVEVDPVVIEDGALPPPRVGSVTACALRFVELPPSSDDVVTVCAPLESRSSPPILQYTGENSARRWEWAGLLRGDGWTASWRGFRPLTDRVQLTGRFFCTDDAEGRTRGRVTRVRIVSERFRRRTRTLGHWEIIPGHRTSREVDAAPRFFDRDGIFGDSDEIDLDVGVLIDLDLDDVPELPPRPSFVPGDVSASGELLWVVDNSLPVLVSIDRDHTVHEHLVPATIGRSRRIRATPTGCCVGGYDGLFRCATGESPIRVDDTQVLTGATLEETLLVCHSGDRWTLHTPDRGPLGLETPGGRVVSIATDRGAFVIAVSNDSEMRLVRVTLDGEVTVGPPLPRIREQHRCFLAGSPLRLFSPCHADPVDDDLTLGTPHSLPKRILTGGGVGPYVWFTDHPPDGTGASGWWPLPGPTVHPRTRQCWLFTLLDGRTLEPVGSTPIFTTRPHVTIDEKGTVWLSADGVHSLPAPAMRSPKPLDVAAMLDASRQ